MSEQNATEKAALSQEQANVLNLIIAADGEAISKKNMLSLLHKGESYSRTFHEIINYLVSAGYPIGSSRENDRKGYYLIKNKADLEAAKHTISSIIKGNTARLEALKRIEL